MKEPQTHVRAYRDPSQAFRLCLYASARTGDRFFQGQPVVFEEYAPGVARSNRGPLMTLEDSEAQLLADTLWDSGIRPSAAKGSAGQLAAVQAHLDDLRRYLDKVIDRMMEKCK
jgi:hypothetical protein